MIKNFTACFMSGTGNSYRAAKWAEKEANKRKIKSDVIPVNRFNCGKSFIRGKSAMIGLFYPTHGFTAPWPVIKLALKMPFGKSTKVFLSASRAGWMIGPWHLPGIEGTATLLIALILWLKGYDVRGFQGLDMPTNWLAVHWGLKKENALWFIKRARKKTSRFVSSIFTGKRLYRGFIFILIGVLFSYISLLYLIAGKLMLAKIMYADYNCNSCGICWENCPFGAIIPVGKKKPAPFWTFKCESCERCIAYCPQKSIQTGALYIALLCWFMYGVMGFIPVAVFDFISQEQSLMFLSSGIPATLISVGYMLAWVFLGYFILFRGSRVKVINKIFTFTTFTKIYRRYHEPGTKIRDMK